MSRFLTTIPSNTGFVNLGLVETYPTGGGGPTAYGPTSYYGSDPRPAEDGDNVLNWLDQSGNGHDFTSTGAIAPIYQSSVSTINYQRTADY